VLSVAGLCDIPVLFPLGVRVYSELFLPAVYPRFLHIPGILMLHIPYVTDSQHSDINDEQTALCVSLSGNEQYVHRCVTGEC